MGWALRDWALSCSECAADGVAEAPSHALVRPRTSPTHHWSLQLLLTPLVSCGAATFVQVVQDHAEEFLKEMNSEVIARQLKSLGKIPETVERNILQSKSKEEANAHLFSHLKEDADEETVMEVFRIASQKPDYGKMNTFAAGVLRKLQRGVYWCMHTHMLLHCTVHVFV